MSSERHLLILNERDLHHPNAGGAEVNLFEVARRLVARGYRATLLCIQHPGARREEVLDGIKVVRASGRLGYYLGLPALVRRHIEADSVVIEHLCKLPFLSPLYTSRPVLPITHHLFGRTAFTQVSPVLATAVVASEMLVPYVYRNCRVIAVSPSTRDDLIQRGIPPQRIRVIPNGVDSEHYTPPLEEPSGPALLLAFGRIEPYKRFDLILRAFVLIRQEIPEARLALVGGGTALQAVRQDIDRLGLRSVVECPGPVDESEKLRYIRASRLLLNASEKEGWGLTVVEGGACGRPTIAADVPGLRDAVIDGRTGLLVPYGNAEAMAAATLALLRDEDRRRTLGANARGWAERFSWDSVADATAASIEEICGAPTVAEAPRWFADADSVADGPLLRCSSPS